MKKMTEEAEILSKKILGNATVCSVKFAKYYRRLLSGWGKIVELFRYISANQVKAMFYQFIYLFYHFTDSLAYQILNPEKRNEFMQILWSNLSETTFYGEDLIQDAKVEYLETMKEEYNYFVLRNSEIEILIEDEESQKPGPALLIDFAKDISGYIGGRQINPGHILHCSSLILEAYEDLNIEKILKEIE